MKVGSLFAGIGGFDIATEAMGWETAWFSEVDPYCCRVLEKRWPGVPNHGDINTLDWDTLEPVDVLTGGFPCQDISVAGKGAGIEEGTCSGLWSEYARAIRHLRPQLVVVENVGALLVRGAARVLGNLAALGYDADWQVLSAAAVGAPHRRERVWIVAHRDNGMRALQPQGSERKERGRFGYGGEASGGDTRWPTPGTGEDHGKAGTWKGFQERKAKAAARGVNLQEKLDIAIQNPRIKQTTTGKLNPDWVETLMGYPIGWTDIEVTQPQMAPGWPAGPGGRPRPSPVAYDAQPGGPNNHYAGLGRIHDHGQTEGHGGQYPWEPPRVTDRKEHRRNRLKALGNSIVPACAHAILEGFMAFTEREKAV